jgi:hypothetical protein
MNEGSADWTERCEGCERAKPTRSDEREASDPSSMTEAPWSRVSTPRQRQRDQLETDWQQRRHPAWLPHEPAGYALTRVPAAARLMSSHRPRPHSALSLAGLGESRTRLQRGVTCSAGSRLCAAGAVGSDSPRAATPGSLFSRPPLPIPLPIPIPLHFTGRCSSTWRTAGSSAQQSRAEDGAERTRRRGSSRPTQRAAQLTRRTVCGEGGCTGADLAQCGAELTGAQRI